MVTITCCKDCKRRFLGCHSVCPEYKKQREQLDEYNELVRQKRLEESLTRNVQNKYSY